MNKRGNTWIDEEEKAYNLPLARSMRQGVVRFADGKLRKVRLGVPDTFFTIPARSSEGKHGYVSVIGDEFTFIIPATKQKAALDRKSLAAGEKE